jgi:hypothetical protein
MACSKNNSTPADNNNNANNTGTNTQLNKTSAISVFINKAPMQVTSIDYNRGDGFFKFTAQNKLQKVDVNCFYFYQPNWGNYQYEDSVNYSIRPDSLSAWNGRHANKWGDVNFECCEGPLTNPDVKGNFYGDFGLGKDSLVITGNFELLFK